MLVFPPLIGNSHAAAPVASPQARALLQPFSVSVAFLEGGDPMGERLDCSEHSCSPENARRFSLAFEGDADPVTFSFIVGEVERAVKEAIEKVTHGSPKHQCCKKSHLACFGVGLSAVVTSVVLVVLLVTVLELHSCFFGGCQWCWCVLVCIFLNKCTT